MKLYCKKAFYQFKVGDQLPELPDNIGMKLVKDGYAQASKPKLKKKPNAETK